MPRRTLDLLLTSVGALLAIVLLVAGSLLTWGSSFAKDNVTHQLSSQKIFFPAKGSPALDPKQFPSLQKYAGQQLTTGEQARAYADDFIGVHVKSIAGGKTYAEVSALAQKSPDDEKLAAQALTLFKGETLRGLLLEAYAFGKFGQIAGFAAIAAFVAAAFMLILTILGFLRIRRADPAAATRTVLT